jgi:hypothetical protein
MLTEELRLRLQVREVMGVGRWVDGGVGGDTMPASCILTLHNPTATQVLSLRNGGGGGGGANHTGPGQNWPNWWSWRLGITTQLLVSAPYTQPLVAGSWGCSWK